MKCGKLLELQWLAKLSELDPFQYDSLGGMIESTQRFTVVP